MNVKYNLIMMEDNLKSIKRSFLFWIIFILIIAIAFLCSKNKIFRVLDETDFFNQVFGSTPEWVAKEIAKVRDKKEETDIMISSIDNDESTLVVVTEKRETLTGYENIEKAENIDDSILAAIEPIQKNQYKEEEEVNSEVQTEFANTHFPQVSNIESTTTKTSDDLTKILTEKKIEKPKETEVSESADKVIEKSTEVAKTTQKTKLLLYFVVIDSDGALIRYEIERNVPKTMTPLTVALNSLLQGPTIGELEKGYVSVIPQGTKLLSASISNRIATLNFSDEFTRNGYGVDGLIGQLMQVVYTATAFSSIDSVQFLIDGQKKEYLGEGVWIGTPLGRSSFK